MLPLPSFSLSPPHWEARWGRQGAQAFLLFVQIQTSNKMSGWVFPHVQQRVHSSLPRLRAGVSNWLGLSPWAQVQTWQQKGTRTVLPFHLLWAVWWVIDSPQWCEWHLWFFYTEAEFFIHTHTHLLGIHSEKPSTFSAPASAGKCRNGEMGKTLRPMLADSCASDREKM